MASADGDELGLLCEELAELRVLASRYGVDTELDSVVADARAEKPVGDRRIELLRQLGIPAGHSREIRLPGLDGGRPTADLYDCPKERCSRSWVRPPGDPVPNCQVYDMPLRHRPPKP